MKEILKRGGVFFGTIGELFGGFGRGRYWWLIPALLLLLPLLLLVLWLQSTPAVAPFVYTLF